MGPDPLGGLASRYERLVDRTADVIVDRPGQVVLVFLVLTGVFALGLGNISTEAGTEQFTSNVPAEEALEAIDREFNPPFAVDSGSTQLIQTGNNVLAKPALLEMLRLQHRLESEEGLRVTESSSTAIIVAQTIDPEARTLEDQIDAVEGATQREVERAVVRAAAANPAFDALLSEDFNRRSGSASATIGVVEHEVPSGLSSGAGMGGTSPLTSIQLRIQHIASTADGDIRAFGSGIFADEFSNVIGDSLLLVVPASVVLIVFFLVVAYRDLVDLLLGVVALGMTIVWTFGFMGLAGIAFSQFLIAVPPLLLAVGIDFGIHAINRYREEREDGRAIGESMHRTGEQLIVAFFIVTGTTVIGFLSNYSSALVPIQDFGLVASIGIVFTFLLFGVFLPAAKVYVDRNRRRLPIPTFSQTPLGAEGSRLGTTLAVVVGVTRRGSVYFLAATLVVSVLAGGYATGIDTAFSQEDFLPAEETPAYLAALPEPFRPSEYTVVRDLNFLEDRFAVNQQDSLTVYVEGPMESPSALESIHRAGRNPPSTIVTDGRQARATSVISVIEARAAVDPEFRRLVARNDRNANGIPDQHLATVYDRLLDSPSRSTALRYLTEDRRSARVVYDVESGASQDEVTADGEAIADRYRFHAVATGNIVVFQAISDLILESAVTSLVIALALSSVFLVVVYTVLEGRPSLGIVNLIPIVVTVAILAGTMRAVGLAFNAFTATVLAITIGLGVDYSVHVTHRFIDEYHRVDADEAILRTVRGTGGALTGSMFTTVFGIGVLVLAVFPAIGNFGLLTGLSVLYSYLTAVLVLPVLLGLWTRYDAAEAPIRQLLGLGGASSQRG